MRHLLTLLVFLGTFLPSQGQLAPPAQESSVALFNNLKKLNFLGSALYIAAHPDDENTRMISYLSNHYHAQTGYLSLTRGDGGQNLIGTELRELLGVLRTQELLAARSVDGGQQFFTRAVDFGYSKHPDETLEIWDKELVLGDVVRTIRKFKPDIIINRFDHRTPGSTHGHHTSSALLSVEAFKMAADKDAYPEQLGSLKTWEPKRLFHNTSWWFYGSPERFKAEADLQHMVGVDVGVYYPELGLSNNEIASMASSQHRCQGFGRLNQRGTEEEFLEVIYGDKPSPENLFEGIDTSWNRVPGGAAVGAVLYPLEKNFNFADPSVHLPELLRAYSLIQQIEDPHWKKIKSSQVKELIAGVLGIYLEASAEASEGTPGDQIKISLELLNRSTAKVVIADIEIENTPVNNAPIELSNNKKEIREIIYKIPENHYYSTPYWLLEKGSLGTYQVEKEQWIGMPRSPAALNGQLRLEIEGVPIAISFPVVHRYSRSDTGELYRDFEVLPPATLVYDEDLLLFGNGESQELGIQIKAQKTGISGALKLNLPEGWSADRISQPFTIAQKGEEVRLTFHITPPLGEQVGTIKPEIRIDNATYSHTLTEINYQHIPAQYVLMPAGIKVVRLDVQRAGEHIGYVMGAGDEIPQSLEAIGYQVHPIAVNEIRKEELERYDAIVMGIRAYNVLEELKFKQEELLDFVEKGGTLIVQYNTSGFRNSFKFPNLAPYSLELSRARVTDEHAAVEFLAPQHPALNYPNKITSKDFEGWVQERGLYFPGSWGKEFTPILSMKDKGEKASEGALLVAPYGKGYYIYTGLSFFRELPSGVPGAFKLFSNLLSIGKSKIKNTDEVKG